MGLTPRVNLPKNKVGASKTKVLGTTNAGDKIKIWAGNKNRRKDYYCWLVVDERNYYCWLVGRLKNLIGEQNDEIF